MSYQPCLHVVLYAPEIPQNTGNVGRTCVAAGAKLWLVRPLGFRLDEKHLRRAGLDYWQFLVWEVVNDWPELLQRLPTRSLWFFTKRAAILHADVPYARGDALVFGSETQGLPETLLAEQAGRAVRIPTRPQVRSLNLSAAVSVGVYEALRQVGWP